MDGQTDKWIQRQTNGCRDIWTHMQTNGHIDKIWTDRRVDTQAEALRQTHMYKQTDIWTDKHAHRETDRKMDMQIDAQTETDIWTHTHKPTHTDICT